VPQLVFPQLTTGAVALYPVTRRVNLRTVVNTLADGSTVVFRDPDAAMTGWELKARGLNSAEWSAIEALFNAVAGRWQTFTLLDPAGNLFAQSEDLGASPWTKGPLIQLTAGIADPLGTARATRAVNTGQAAQAVVQTLAVPQNFVYSMSVWARTEARSGVTLLPSGEAFALGPQWQRISTRVRLGQSGTGITFGAQLEAGATVDLFGMQTEAQPAPSDYKKTGETGGVRTARFASDAFTVRAQSMDVYDVAVRMVSAGS